MSDLQPLEIFKVPLNGTSLVESSAGTGKTYNIASLYVRAILELGLEPSQILVMTFTEAATAELKARLRERIRESLSVFNQEEDPEDEFFSSLLSAGYTDPKHKLKKALDSFDEASVFTIHGFCNRLLTEYTVHFDVPSNVELLTNGDELLQECVDEYWLEFNRRAQGESTQWFALNYLIEIGFGPDELKKLVKEVLAETNARIIPDLKLENLETEVKEIQGLFSEIKNQWSEQKTSLKDILFSGHLHGGKFKKDKLDDYWNVLSDWVEKSGFSFKYPPEIKKFSLYLYDSLNKSAPDYEVLGISRSIDRFIDLFEGLSKIKVAFLNESIDTIRTRYKALKQSRQVLEYDDMLTKVEEGLKAETSISLRKRLALKYPFALVDEFQDTDQIQYNILKSIYHNREDTGLFMIGDPKQAIYSFRGADVYTYLEAKSDLTKGQAYGLMENYRSNSRMIEGVNQLFEGSQHSFIDHEIQYQKARFPVNKDDLNYLYDNEGNKVNPLQFIELNNDKYTNKSSVNEDIYSALTRQILELTSGKYKVIAGNSEALETVKEKHIAILVWKGADGEKIQEVLRDAGIKSVLRSNTSVFSTEVSIDLFRALNAILNLSYELGLKAALAGSLFGYSAVDLKDLEENEYRWATLIADLTTIRDEWNKHGFERALNLFFDQFQVFETLSSYQNAERKISNLLHLTELISIKSRDNRFNPNALVRWFYSKINDDTSAKAKDEEQLRLESDDELVQITTMHSSKGLQYPIVFCPFLWSSKVISDNEELIKLKKDGKTIVDLSGEVQHDNKQEYIQIARDQNKAEDVRLAYVSLTRSISACYVFLPDYNKIQNSPISYILNGKDISDSIDFASIRSKIETKEHIELREPEQGPVSNNNKSDFEPETLKVKSFKRNDVLKYPRMLSYSSLVGGHGDDGSAKDHDGILNENTYKDDKITKVKNRFSFPRGANAGSFLHQIFEDISFQEPDDLSKLVQDNLLRFGFEEHWQEPVREWMEQSLHHNLGIPDTSLSALPDAQVIKEMEFFFPVNKLQTSEIWRLIRLKYSDNSEVESFEGYLKGYIDLIFEWQGKYYILDYKSNHLGNDGDDYCEEALNNAMLDAGYDLQYHLYTLALDRYLSTSISDYTYEEQFGGVLYLFLRGIDPSEPGSGIFFDKPDPQLIRSLNDIMKKGGS